MLPVSWYRWGTNRQVGFETVGFLTEFLYAENSRSAKEQLDDNYKHGGGWQSFSGFKLTETKNLAYPGDPPYKPIAFAKLRDETIIFYPHSWVCIVQPDGSYDVARMD